MTLIKLHKPNIGVLSMQRVINYGSFLQAYGLRQLLLQNGAGSVSFVDIEPGRILVEQPSKPLRRTKELFKLIFEGRIIERIRTHYFSHKLKRTFVESAWPQLRLDNPEQTRFDLMVIGSDEVFNCCQACGTGYTPQLFGRIKPEIATRVVTYAASFGFSTLSMLKHYGVADDITEMLQADDAISVRDVNSQDIVEALTGSRPPLHLDPVLIYGFKKEIDSYTKRPCSEKYLIVYTYAERIRSKAEIKAIKEYAKRHNLKIFSIFCWYIWVDQIIIPENPMDVLMWFKHADCIVTDTFHGTIFSIITHSRFATFIRPSNKNKLTSLLDSTGLPMQAVESISQLTDILNQVPDYNNVEKLLDSERIRTNAFLKSQLPEM